MTRTEKLLWYAAECRWMDTGDDLVTIYRAFHKAGSSDRGAGLYCAATMSALLQTPSERLGCLEALKRRLPTSDREGAKKQRGEAALEALERLISRAKAES